MAKDIGNVKRNNPFVAIGCGLAGIFLVICIFFLIFASSQAWVLIFIALAFVLLGLFMGLFAYKSAGK